MNIELKFGTKYRKNKTIEFLNENMCRQSCALKTECYKQYFISYPTLSKFFSKTDTSYNNYIFLTIEYPAQPNTTYEISIKMSAKNTCVLCPVYSVFGSVSQ